MGINIFNKPLTKAVIFIDISMIAQQQIGKYIFLPEFHIMIFQHTFNIFEVTKKVNV